MKHYNRHSAIGVISLEPESGFVAKGTELIEMLGYCSNGATNGDGRDEREGADSWVELWSHRLSDRHQEQWHELYPALWGG